MEPTIPVTTSSQLGHNYLYDFNKKKVMNIMMENFDFIVDSTFDVYARVKREFDTILEENQIEIVETVIDVTIKNIGLLGSRSGGKTYSVIIGCAVMAIDGFNGKPISIGFTAPKEDQAIRCLTTFFKIVRSSAYLKTLIDLKHSTTTKILFYNGSVWEAFSGSELANEEGRHYDVLVMDESQRLSDYSVSRVLLPMLGQSTLRKVIKLGVPKGKGHFYKSMHGGLYITLAYDWLQCGNLLKGGYREINGVKYSNFVLDRMPLSKKQEYFPDNPDLWYDGDMSVEDFETQYEIIWLSDVNNALKEEDQLLLFGQYEPLGPTTGEYFFGLDLAGGELLKNKTEGCYSSLTIGRIRNGVKEVVDAFEWRGNVYDQMEEMLDIIHPLNGLYKCKWGLADYGEMGPAVVDTFMKQGVKMLGIMFGASDPHSKKNYKNAMLDHFLFELRASRFKFPHSNYVNKHKALKKHLGQFVSMERHSGSGINDFIVSPGEGIYTDGFWSTLLMVYGIDKRIPLSISMNLTNKNTAHIRNYFPKLLKGTPIVKSLNPLGEMLDG